MTTNPAIIDFETRSVADLKKVGAWNYSKHPTTEILCMAYKLPGQDVDIWTPDRGFPSSLVDHIKKKRLIEAHNVLFEIVHWLHIGEVKHGFPKVEMNQWRCSAALAARYGLPRTLWGAGKALRLPFQKDMDGHKLMLKMSKPRNIKKPGLHWHEDLNDLLRLYEYCKADVMAEYAISEHLPPLSEYELRIFQVTLEMNLRGIYCDIELSKASIEIMGELKKEAEKELYTLTDGAVDAVTKREKLYDWVNLQGYPIENLQKSSVEIALSDGNCPPKVKRALQLRYDFGKSSVSKYDAMLLRADSEDHRIRDHLRYHGAHTGRHAGQGIQSQNFFRPDWRLGFGKEENINCAVKIVKTKNAELLTATYEKPANVLASLLRPTLQAPPGKLFWCIDYSSIEAVLVLWFCQDKGLQLIRDKKCIYRKLAGALHGISDWESIPKKDPIRNHGKVGFLAGQYGAGWRKVAQVARTQWKIDLSDTDFERMNKTFRLEYPGIPKTWKKLNDAAVAAMRGVHKPLPFGVKFEREGRCLVLTVPNGNKMYYNDPELKMEPMPWNPEEKRPIVYYWTEDSQTKTWVKTKSYGGKWLENVIQKVARELICSAMIEITDEPGLGDLVITVHDELVGEVDEDRVEEACAEACKLMRKRPWWAKDCPIDVEAWIGRFYRK